MVTFHEFQLTGKPFPVIEFFAQKSQFTAQILVAGHKTFMPQNVQIGIRQDLL